MTLSFTVTALLSFLKIEHLANPGAPILTFCRILTIFAFGWIVWRKKSLTYWILFGLFAGLQDNGLFILVILAAAFSVRLASILWRIELWHPWAGQPGGPALARED